MGNIGLLKRALPFLATFALSLFVASFFVNISPRFEHHERGRCHRDMWEMRIENEQQKETIRAQDAEIRRLREQLQGHLTDVTPIDETFENDLEAPPPPIAPVKPHKAYLK